MKEILKQYAAYNAWANLKLCEAILSLSPELQQKEVVSSFPNLHLTVLHMWDASSIWWQRMKMQENVVAPSINFRGSTQEAVHGLQQQDRLWEEWVANANDMSLEHVFKYYKTKSEYYKQPVHQVVMQVMNHGTYHRGQIVMMLRQLGFLKIPQTDFVVWCRKRS
jgi:uncharacterized damage-inducible protein DinB